MVLTSDRIRSSLSFCDVFLVLGPKAAWPHNALQVPSGHQPELKRAHTRRGPHRRLHERVRHDLQHGGPDDEGQVVRVGGHHVLLRQLRQLQNQRRHQTDPEQLHALDLGRRHVVPAEPGAHEAALGDVVVGRGREYRHRDLDSLCEGAPAEAEDSSVWCLS